MKKYFLLILFLTIPFLLYGQNDRPWVLGVGGGGISMCDDIGCFGPTGYILGGSFGRNMSDRWAFELEGWYGRSTEILNPRFDQFTGIFFTPELERTRVHGGFTFLGSLVKLGSSDFFIAFGFTTGFERKDEITPAGVFGAPTRNLGIRAGASGGAGLNIWFSEGLGVRPEIRFYAVPDISDLRYTASLLIKF